MKGKKIMMIALLMLSSSAIYAQMPEIQHDEQKEKQWKSMENGPWDFAPDWYYWLMHNSYSGASTYWAWRGFHSGLHVRFRESDSNVKRIMPVRVTSEETQRQKMKKVEDERQYIEELHKEDVLRQADRNVTRSKGKMKAQVNELSRQNEIVCQNIAYIHKTGIGYELENAKRQKAYIEAKQQMEELVSRTAHLVGMAQSYYK